MEKKAKVRNGVVFASGVIVGSLLTMHTISKKATSKFNELKPKENN